jgi:hypothetical protein
MVWVVVPSGQLTATSGAVAPLALAADPLEKLRVGSTAAPAVARPAQGTERAGAPSARLRKKARASLARAQVPARLRPAREQQPARCC